MPGPRVPVVCGGTEDDRNMKKVSPQLVGATPGIETNMWTNIYNIYSAVRSVLDQSVSHSAPVGVQSQVWLA